MINNLQDGVFRQYRGARDKDSFISFVEEKKWQVCLNEKYSLLNISREWSQYQSGRAQIQCRCPSSLTSSSSPWSFATSTPFSLRTIRFGIQTSLTFVLCLTHAHTQLPYWVSYVAFAVATVLLGGLLGLFLVISSLFGLRIQSQW